MVLKAFGSGLKKVKHRARKLVGVGNEERQPSAHVEEKGSVDFPMDVSGPRGTESDYDVSLEGRPFKMPIFIEMGQAPEAAKEGVRKIGGDILFLYDIDDTLYHPSNNLQLLEREFIKEKYLSLKDGSTAEGFESDIAEAHLYSSLFYTQGLLSLEEYWEMLSEFDYLQYLSADERLRSFLLSLEGVRRCCFTNGPRDRAENILTKMGILDCFEVVICIGKNDKTFCYKPRTESYDFVTKVLGIETPGNVHFFDDSEANISKAREVGWNGWLMTGECNIIDVSLDALQAARANSPQLCLQEKMVDVSNRAVLN